MGQTMRHIVPRRVAPGEEEEEGQQEREQEQQQQQQQQQQKEKGDEEAARTNDKQASGRHQTARNWRAAGSLLLWPCPACPPMLTHHTQGQRQHK